MRMMMVSYRQVRQALPGVCVGETPTRFSSNRRRSGLDYGHGTCFALMKMNKGLVIGVLVCLATLGSACGQANSGTATQIRLDQTTEQMEKEGEELAKAFTNQVQALRNEQQQKSRSDIASNPWLYVALGVGIIIIFRKLPGMLAARPSQRNRAKPQEMVGVPDKISIDEVEAEREENASDYRETQFLDRFFCCVSEDLGSLRKSLCELGRLGPGDEQQKVLEQLLEDVRALKGKSSLSALRPLFQLAEASEDLLKHLVDKGESLQGSTLRTIASAIDLLHSLSVRGLRGDLATHPTPRLLAVDDDPVSRYAVGFAVNRALVKPDMAAQGEAALALAEETAYDLILLDVQMPGMDGFELCSRIHATAQNRTTPIVFVTCRSDFDARTKSSLIGGQELIGKPFMAAELGLKALTLVLRGRLQRDSRAARRHAKQTTSPPGEALSKPSETPAGFAPALPSQAPTPA